ncbi:hypothetical protein LTS09_007601 [Friedmanniomyces endolithicus]|nr:hypothetical protein LTS09_007601 [Friedmanniomyces endolithicus]
MPPKRKVHSTSLRSWYAHLKTRTGKSVDAESDVSGDDFATSAPAPKKRQTHTRLKTHTLESLLAMPHEELAAHALSLQNQASQRTNGNGAEAAWTDEKITERAKKTRDICKAGIERQLKWQPSCKAGTTKWSYTGLVPHEDVFYKLFQFEKPKKPWKVKKISQSDLYEILGGVSASVRIRYGTLRLTGEGVRVNWDQEEKTFKLSGTYGL